MLRISIRDEGDTSGFAVEYTFVPGLNDKVVYKDAKNLLRDWIAQQDEKNQVERKVVRYG